MNENNPTLLEGGHFYLAKGETESSFQTWKLAEQKHLEILNSQTIVFVDDVHPIDAMSQSERDSPLTDEKFIPDFVVQESQMGELAMGILEEIFKPLGKKKCKQDKHENYFYSGIKLTKNNRPTCVLYDLALTLFKYNLGYKNIVNVLPAAYKGEQENLSKLVDVVFAQLGIDDCVLETVYLDETFVPEP